MDAIITPVMSSSISPSTIPGITPIKCTGIVLVHCWGGYFDKVWSNSTSTTIYMGNSLAAIPLGISKSFSIPCASDEYNTYYDTVTVTETSFTVMPHAVKSGTTKRQYEVFTL